MIQKSMENSFHRDMVQLVQCIQVIMDGKYVKNQLKDLWYYIKENKKKLKNKI